MFFIGMFYHPDIAWKWVWLYPVIPFNGAILGILFFEFAYKKSIDN
jgi:glycerol uptake facilitator-like aquaporin